MPFQSDLIKRSETDMNQNYDYTPQNDQSYFAPYTPLENTPVANGHAKGYATASLWLGLSSILVCCCCCCFYYIAFILSIISIVMAFLARRDNLSKMPGKAVTGLILACIGLVLFVLILIVEINLLLIPPEEFQTAIDQSFIDNFGMTYREFMEEMMQLE